MTRYFIWFVLLLSLRCLPHVQAQVNTASEKRFYASSVKAALGNLAEDEKAIYSGPLYTQYFVKMGNDGHPFYHSLQPEAIMYDSILYSSVNFIYDIFLDEVVVINPDSAWICLNKKKVNYFLLGGHKLTKIQNVNGLPSGFYEVLYEDNDISLFAKWTKVFNASVWKEKVSFFVVKEKVYAVHNKRELLDALGDRESEIRNFIRQNKLRFKKAQKIESFAKIVGFYSSIRKQP
jgi:hypothetical protein